MVGLSSRFRRPASSPRAASFRPALEALESRDCPSTLWLTVTATPASKQLTLSGTVTNTSTPGGLTVRFSGVAPGSTTTDSEGNFSVSLTASVQGTVYAATSDGQSNIVQGSVIDPGTTMTSFMGGEEPLDVWVFSGKVQGGYQNEVVNLGGIHSLVGKTTTTDANGNWSYTVDLDRKQDDNGEATASAVDAWGVQSNEQYYLVTQTLLGAGGGA